MNRLNTLIGLNISIFMLMAGQGMISVLLPERIMELAVSESSAGYLASAFAFTYILVQVPLGRMSDRHSFKPFIVAGYMFIGLAGLIYHYAGSANLVFVGRMVQGMGEAPLWALAPALLSIQSPSIKGRVFGLYNAALNLGLTVGPSMALVLRHQRWNGSLFLVFAGIALAGAFLVWMLVQEENHVDPLVAPVQYGNVFQQLKRVSSAIPCSLISCFLKQKTKNKALKKKTIRDVLAGVFLYGGGYGLFVSTIPAFLMQTKGLDQTGAGLYFTLIFLSMGLSQLLAGPLTDRWGPGWFMTGGLVLAGGGLLAFPGLSGPWIHLSLVLTGLGLGAFGVTSLVFLNEQADNAHKGEISGLYYQVWAFGYFGLPLAGAQVGHRLGLDLFFRLCAGLVILAALLSITAKRGKNGR